MVAVVRFAGCVNNMVFVKAGVFCEALFTPRHRAHIRFLPGVNPHMVLVVGGTSEGPSTGGLRAVVWPLTSVCSDVNFADVGCGK